MTTEMNQAASRRRFLGSVVAAGATLALADCARDGSSGSRRQPEKLLDQQLQAAIKHVVVICRESQL